MCPFAFCRCRPFPSFLVEWRLLRHRFRASSCCRCSNFCACRTCCWCSRRNRHYWWEFRWFCGALSYFSRSSISNIRRLSPRRSRHCSDRLLPTLQVRVLHLAASRPYPGCPLLLRCSHLPGWLLIFIFLFSCRSSCCLWSSWFLQILSPSPASVISRRPWPHTSRTPARRHLRLRRPHYHIGIHHLLDTWHRRQRSQLGLYLGDCILQQRLARRSKSQWDAAFQSERKSCLNDTFPAKRWPHPVASFHTWLEYLQKLQVHQLKPSQHGSVPAPLGRNQNWKRSIHLKKWSWRR